MTESPSSVPAAPPPLPPQLIEKPKAAAAPAFRDGLARGLSVLALGAGLGALAYGIVRPDPVPPAPEVTAAALNAVRQQVSELSGAVESLKAAPPAPTVTHMPAAENAATSDQLNNALTEIAALRDKIANLQQGIAGAEDVKQQLAQLKNDLAVANTAISGMRGHVQQMTDNAQQVAAAESATRAHVIAYLELRSAAAAAAPFTRELEALCAVTKTLAPLAAECVKLGNPAHAGVATLPMLQSRFAVMSPAAERAVALADAKSWTDRLKVSLDEVVHIRKIGDTGATETPQLIHDAAAALQRGNLVEAVAKVAAMPPAAQKELEEWRGDARARVALDAALARIGAALGQMSTPQKAASDSAEPESGTPGEAAQP